jgi:hypothetical protein
LRRVLFDAVIGTLHQRSASPLVELDECWK